jgi:ankyrin repeat protein
LVLSIETTIKLHTFSLRAYYPVRTNRPSTMKVFIRIFVILGCLFLGFIIFVGTVYRDRRPRIYFAAESGDTNAIAQYLALGSNVNANINCYPFSERVERAPLLDVAVQNGQIETINFLLSNGANPNQVDFRGDPPIMWAIGRVANHVSPVSPEKHLQIFKMLLAAGASPNAPAASEYRYTPLIEAASLGQTQIVRELLAVGANVNGTNKIGQTALHLSGRHADVTKLLLLAGADPKAKDASGATPIDYMIRDGYTNALAVLTNAAAWTNH